MTVKRVQPPGPLGRRLVAGAILLAALWLMSPLFLPVVMGAILAAVVFPALEKLEARKIGTGLASVIVTSGVTGIFVLPAAFLIFVGAKAGWKQLKVLKDAAPAGAPPVENAQVSASFIQDWLESPRVRDAVEWLTDFLPVSLQEIAHQLELLAKEAALKLADISGAFFTQLPGLTLGLALMVLSLYFFLQDGRAIGRYLKTHSLFDKATTQRLIVTFSVLCRSVILASLASGAAQAVLFLVGLLVTGTPNTALLTLLVFLCSFLPLVGAAPVTFGAAIFQFAQGSKGAGLVLVFFAVGAALVDNIVRPLVLKGGGNMHPLLAFLAALGGLQTLGFAGIFVGPIVAGLAIALLDELLGSPHEA